MKEHQIIASVDGQFLFRTDWDDNVVRVYRAMERLKGAHVELFIYSRDKSMERRSPVEWMNEFLKEQS